MKKIVIDVLPGVYPPSDDSYMLAEAVNEMNLIGKRFLEIGCGSGIVAITAAVGGADVTAVDINPVAVKNTIVNAERSGVHVNAFVSDLFENVKGTYDVIAFNPPYLPSDENDPAYDVAWSGGKDGRKVLDRFLEEVDMYLRPCGIVLLIQSSLNAPEKTFQKFGAMGYAVDIIRREQFFMEELYLLRAVKPCR